MLSPRRAIKLRKSRISKKRQQQICFKQKYAETQADRGKAKQAEAKHDGDARGKSLFIFFLEQFLEVDVTLAD